MACSRSDHRLALLIAVLLCGLLLPSQARAHAKGLYKTRAEAETRAKELGCKGTHQNNGMWTPCANEALLHKHLRQQ